MLLTLLNHPAFRGNTRETNGCWVCALSPNKRYAFVGYKKDSFAAHRLAYMLTHGDIPDNMCVCHKCDNPKCIRPSHLFIGTQLDNIADMDAKGRRGRTVGELNSHAKLTWYLVGLIRKQ